MNKKIQLSQTKTILRRVQALVPDWLDRLLLSFVAMIRRLPKRRVKVELITGRTRLAAYPAAALTVGRASTVDYLLQRFFTDTISYANCQPVFWRQVRGCIANYETANLAIIRCNRNFVLSPEWRNCWRIPDGVRSIVDLDIAAGKPRFQHGNSSHRRRIRKHELYPAISHDTKEFADFFENAYLPYIRTRFGDFARPHSRTRLARSFSKGGLLWVERNESHQAGMLFSIVGDTARIHVAAPVQNQRDAIRMGAVSAARKFLIDIAISEGRKAVDMGISRPNLLDGVLVHKKHWGARISSTSEFDTELRIRWKKFSPDIRDWLFNTPLIVRDEDGLSALTTLPGNYTEIEAHRHLVRVSSPGLQRMIVITAPNGKYDFETVNGLSVCWRDSSQPCGGIAV